MATKCEDYPCCGHTDGLPCDWVYTPAAQEFDSIHFGCEHEMGFCEADDYDEEYDENDDVDEPFVMEDQWLDGSYEE